MSRVRPEKVGQVRQSRIASLKLRGQRIRRLWTLNKQAKKVFYMGVMPSFRFGAEVTGIDKESIRLARNEAATLDGHARLSRDIWGACNPRKDPIYQLVVPAILRYCEEWWRHAAPGQRNGRMLTTAILTDALRTAQRALARGRTSTGPAYRMLQMLQWAGWEVLSPFVLKDLTGHQWHMGTNAPADLRTVLERDILAQVEARATDKVRQILMGLGHTQEEVDAYKPWWSEARRLMNSKACPLHKNLLMRAFGDCLLTNDKWQRWGYQVNSDCPHCPGKLDTAWHRAMECKLAGMRRRRAKEEGHNVRNWQPWQLELTAPEPYRRLLLPVEPDIAVQPSQSEMRAYVNGSEVPVDSFRFDPMERAASDGSANNVLWPAIARAGWAVTQFAQGTWRILMGTVDPHLRQNAATAEHVAAMHAALKGVRGALAIDCNAVLSTARRPVQQRVDYRRKHGTWWKRVGLLATSQWHKVRAHVDVPENPVTDEEKDIWLNDKADNRAKESLKWHGLAECTESDYKVAATRAKHFLTEAACNMAEHPPPREQGIEYHKEPKQGHQLVAKVRHPHQWYWTHRGTWRCRQCWREKWQTESQQNFEPCGSVGGTMRQLGICAPFHQLTAAVVDGGPEMVIFCRACGGFAENRASKLAGPTCKATSWTRRSLRRLEQGFHPTRNAALSDYWDLSQAKGTQHLGEDAAAWAEEQRSQSTVHMQPEDLGDGSDTGQAGVTVDVIDKLRVQEADAEEQHDEGAGTGASKRRRLMRKAPCGTQNAAGSQAKAQVAEVGAFCAELSQMEEEEREAAMYQAAQAKRPQCLAAAGHSTKRRLLRKAPCTEQAATEQQSSGLD